jgi:hypothetical protein
MQQLASPSGIGGEPGDDPGASGMARPGSPSMPSRGPIASRPLGADARQAAEMESLLPRQPNALEAAPGSLRVSELIGPEAFGGAGDPASSAAGEPTTGLQDSTDPQMR